MACTRRRTCHGRFVAGPVSAARSVFNSVIYLATVQRHCGDYFFSEKITLLIVVATLMIIVGSPHGSVQP
jgi:hypothetical protein